LTAFLLLNAPRRRHSSRRGSASSSAARGHSKDHHSRRQLYEVQRTRPARREGRLAPQQADHHSHFSQSTAP
jgi:hypothetical protein